MKSFTITPNASVIVTFDSLKDRDAAIEQVGSQIPRASLSRVTGGGAGTKEDPATMEIRIQHVSAPITISVDGEEASVSPNVLNQATGTPGYVRFQGRKAEDVPGVNAEAGVHLKPKTSGVNLTKDVPGAVNNDPSTASNAGYEGSPAQAIQSAVGSGTGTPTPGGFVGPDKAAKVEGGVGGVPALSKEDLHPEGQKPDKVAVQVSKEAAKVEAQAAKEAKADEK